MFGKQQKGQVEQQFAHLLALLFQARRRQQAAQVVEQGQHPARQRDRAVEERQQRVEHQPAQFFVAQPAALAGRYRLHLGALDQLLGTGPVKVFEHIPAQHRRGQFRRTREAQRRKLIAGGEAHNMGLGKTTMGIQRTPGLLQPGKHVVLQWSVGTQRLEKRLPAGELEQGLAVQRAIQQASAVGQRQAFDQISVTGNISRHARLADECERAHTRLRGGARRWLKHTAQAHDAFGAHALGVAQMQFQRQQRQLLADLGAEAFLAHAALLRVVQQAMAQAQRISAPDVQAHDQRLQVIKAHPVGQRRTASALQGHRAGAQRRQVGQRELRQIQLHGRGCAHCTDIAATSGGDRCDLPVDQFDVIQIERLGIRVIAEDRLADGSHGEARGIRDAFEKRAALVMTLEVGQLHQVPGVTQAVGPGGLAQPGGQLVAVQRAKLVFAPGTQLDEAAGLVQPLRQRRPIADLRALCLLPQRLDQFQLLLTQQLGLRHENRPGGLVQAQSEGAFDLAAPARRQALYQRRTRVEAIQPAAQGVQQHQAALRSGNMPLDQHRTGQVGVQAVCGIDVHRQQPHIDITHIVEPRALRGFGKLRNDLRRGGLDRIQGAGGHLQRRGADTLTQQVGGQPGAWRLLGLSSCPEIHQCLFVHLDQQGTAFVEQALDRLQIDVRRTRKLRAAFQAEKVHATLKIEGALGTETFDQHIGQVIDAVALPRQGAVQGENRRCRAGDGAQAPLFVDDLSGDIMQRGPGREVKGDGAAERYGPGHPGEGSGGHERAS